MQLKQQQEQQEQEQQQQDQAMPAVDAAMGGNGIAMMAAAGEIAAATTLAGELGEQVQSLLSEEKLG